jgi:hypothetical protein
MFKRINKRIQKKEKEEAAGINDEMKEILGMQDTDSDESDSSSNSEHDSSDADSSDSEESEDEGSSEPQKFLGLKRRLETEDEDSDGSEQEDGSEDAEDTESTAPPMTVAEALSEPLYPVRSGSDARECILCPGKELKHAKMASVHVSSSVSWSTAPQYHLLRI